MDIRPILVANLGFTHGLLDGSVDGLTNEELHHRSPDSKISSIASIYVHAVLSEDEILSGILKHEPLVFTTGGWAEKLGVRPSGGLASDDWRDAVRLDDVATFKAYAQAVYAAVTAFIMDASDEDLARMVPSPVGEQSVASLLNNFLLWHTIHHLGELCALRGQLGHKGLPF